MPLIFGGIWQSIWLFVFAAVGTAKDPLSNKGSGYRKCSPVTYINTFPELEYAFG
jgi:hypothetical protein